MVAKGLNYSDARQRLINAVIDAGNELIKNAPGYIVDVARLTSIAITIDPSFTPTIEVKQNYICQTAYDRLIREMTENRNDEHADHGVDIR